LNDIRNNYNIYDHERDAKRILVTVMNCESTEDIIRACETAPAETYLYWCLNENLKDEDEDLKRYPKEFILDCLMAYIDLC